MRVYHASTHIVEFPSIRVTRHTKDFSWGFYCIDRLMAVKQWAQHNSKTPIINIYEYEEDNNLNFLYFDKMTDEWLDFIVKCRKGFVHHYDVVKGPLLEEDINIDVENYLNGKISSIEFWEKMQSKKPIGLISFHTVRALSHLKYVASENVE
ncbi:MAG: DUF3990 domain-containing protein [Cellulosilyticum sp.]|nr:DUF3990 domain-containing protein [Cellulosilyticum sp.]